jgi:hypothetical protein
MKLEFSGQVFDESWNIKFRQKRSSGSRVVLCVRADRKADMTKAIVAFPNFANAPKNVVTTTQKILYSHKKSLSLSEIMACLYSADYAMNFLIFLEENSCDYLLWGGNLIVTCAFLHRIYALVKVELGDFFRTNLIFRCP